MFDDVINIDHLGLDNVLFDKTANETFWPMV